MSSRKKSQRPESRVSWISLNFGILILLLLMALVGWAAWYLPRNLSTVIEYKVADPPATSDARI